MHKTNYGYRKKAPRSEKKKKKQTTHVTLGREKQQKNTKARRRPSVTTPLDIGLGLVIGGRNLASSVGSSLSGLYRVINRNPYSSQYANVYSYILYKKGKKNQSSVNFQISFALLFR